MGLLVTSMNNRNKIFLLAICFTVIPLAYFVYSKLFTLQKRALATFQIPKTAIAVSDSTYLAYSEDSTTIWTREGLELKFVDHRSGWHYTHPNGSLMAMPVTKTKNLERTGSARFPFLTIDDDGSSLFFDWEAFTWRRSSFWGLPSSGICGIFHYNGIVYGLEADGAIVWRASGATKRRYLKGKRFLGNGSLAISDETSTFAIVREATLDVYNFDGVQLSTTVLDTPASSVYYIRPKRAYYAYGRTISSTLGPPLQGQEHIGFSDLYGTSTLSLDGNVEIAFGPFGQVEATYLRVNSVVSNKKSLDNQRHKGASAGQKYSEGDEL